MGFLSTAGRVFDGIIEGFAWLAGFLMLFSLTSVCVDVALRYFFNKPTGWVLQVSEYILLYIPFMAAAFVLREDGHIRVDIILNRLGSKAQELLNTLTSILASAVLLVLTYYGGYITLDFYQRNVPTLKYLKIPEYLVVAIIPVGCFLFALQFLRRALRSYGKFKAKLEENS